MVDQSEFGENKSFKRFSEKTLVAVWRESGTLLFVVGLRGEVVRQEVDEDGCVSWKGEMG